MCGWPRETPGGSSVRQHGNGVLKCITRPPPAFLPACPPAFIPFFFPRFCGIECVRVCVVWGRLCECVSECSVCICLYNFHSPLCQSAFNTGTHFLTPSPPLSPFSPSPLPHLSSPAPFSIHHHPYSSFPTASHHRNWLPVTNFTHVADIPNSTTTITVGTTTTSIITTTT